MVMPEYYGPETIQSMIDEAGEDGGLCLWCDETFNSPHASECPKCGSGDIVQELGYWKEQAEARS